MKTVGIIQPNYLPWRGYFDFIHEVDVFVLLDDVQYTPRDWRSRNRIRMPDGSCRWITVPVLGGRDQQIRDVLIDDSQAWRHKHLQSLRHSYGRTPWFARYYPPLEAIVGDRGLSRLCDLDVALTRAIAGWLGLTTPLLLASSFATAGSKDDKLLALVRAVGGDEYLSGPAARDYLVPSRWTEAGIALRYKDYDGYADYAQIAAPFEPAISIVDLLFMQGPAAPDYIWGAHRRRAA